MQSTKEDIMTFLQWMLDTYHRIRKRSTVHEYKRVFAMLYRKSVGESLHHQVNEELNDVRTIIRHVNVRSIIADNLPC
jgi:hypothetical protein